MSCRQTPQQATSSGNLCRCHMLHPWCHCGKCAELKLSVCSVQLGGDRRRTAESVYRTPLRSSNSSSSQVPSPARPSPRHAPCWIVSLLVARSDSSRNDLRQAHSRLFTHAGSTVVERKTAYQQSYTTTIILEVFF